MANLVKSLQQRSLCMMSSMRRSVTSRQERPTKPKWRERRTRFYRPGKFPPGPYSYTAFDFRDPHVAFDMNTHMFETCLHMRTLRLQHSNALETHSHDLTACIILKLAHSIICKRMRHHRYRSSPTIAVRLQCLSGLSSQIPGPAFSLQRKK